MPLTVALDLDGVLYDTVGGLLAYLEERWQIKRTRESIVQYSFANLTGKKEVDSDLIRCLYSPSFYATLKPYPGAIEAVNRLSEVAKLHVITSRPITAQGITFLSVSRDFPNVIRIHHTKRKARLARALRIRYAVDDHLPTAEEYAEARVRTWVVRHPYTGQIPRNRYLLEAESMADAADQICSRQHPQEVEE